MKKPVSPVAPDYIRAPDPGMTVLARPPTIEEPMPDNPFHIFIPTPAAPRTNFYHPDSLGLLTEIVSYPSSAFAGLAEPPEEVDPSFYAGDFAPFIAFNADLAPCETNGVAFSTSAFNPYFKSGF